MITVKRLYDVGSGGIVDYLIDSVADGGPAVHAHYEGTAYYTQAGTPPGRWLGSGLAGLADGEGLEAGSTVSADQLRALIEAGEDPVTGQPLGRRIAAPVNAAARVRALVRALPADLSEAERAARTAQIEREVARTTRSRAVHGLDFTFAPPKSVSTVWALGDAGVREQVEAAHRDAIDHVISVMEAHSIRTRIGTGGVVQTETRGIVAAAFDHYDSRAGDPHLHTHLVVANRVQGPDGKWRTLDSHGALLPAQVALSEAYDNYLMDSVSARLGAEWSVRSISRTGREHWEIDGVTDRLLHLFSRRHTDIEAAREQVDGPGHWDADAKAWGATRQAKQHRSLADLTSQWRQQAATVTGGVDPLRGVLGRPLPAPGTLAGAPGTRTHPMRAADLAADDVDQLAAHVIQELQRSRPSWTMWNVRAEAQRTCRRLRMESPAQRDQVTEAVATAAIGMSVRVDHAQRAHTPARYRRADGSSRFIPEHSEIYTAQALIDAEDALIRMADDATGPRLPDLDTSRPVAGRRQLTQDQADAIRSVATSGRRLDVMVGPAGAGKTTALRALTDAWQQHGGRVTALAPSSAAAEVLAESLGAPAENMAMWLTLRKADADRQATIQALKEADDRLASGARARQVRRDLQAVDPDAFTGLPALARRPALQAAIRSRIASLQAVPERAPLAQGDLVIVDEASMAATLPLHEIAAQADAVGAKLLTVGDPGQLAAVEAGGAFGMLVDHRDVPTLATIHRFADQWQGPASLALRAGDHRAITTYADAGAITSGRLDQVVDQVHAAWRAETAAGRTSLMIASTNELAAELAGRARADLVADGTVRGREVGLADGNHASAGDTVVTRLNARHLRSGDHWAHNGATWHVVAAAADGALLVTPTADPAAEAIHLPAQYVREQVELAYATTIHRAQGRTVDDAHLVVDPSSGIGREGLYVGLTRGRHRNIAHVVTDPEDLTDDLLTSQQPASADEILAAVLDRSSAPLTARRAADQAAEQAESIAQLANEYTTIAAGDAAWGWEGALEAILPAQADALMADQWADALTRELDRAARAGVDVRTVLPSLAQRSPLDPAHPAADLTRRVRQVRTRAEHGRRRLIVGLIPAAPPATDLDVARALAEREQLITARAGKVLNQAMAAGETWTASLGRPPADPQARARWLQAARTVAAYRDRWQVTSPKPAPGQAYELEAMEDPLGVRTASTNRVQAEDRRRAAYALRQAQTIAAGRARPAPSIGTTDRERRPRPERAPEPDL
ncbi:MobF family relaxase [Actinomyces succiniciruminis]|uniref:TrwC relaxase n=1 Tax=Actinomyces succiniciruminis TaxID=1522002 RepID=A0A1L7RM67_9ACTO|nr:MobF family relaxase [Actinomyces succiniciruminis]CED91280.1 TrwC relaxase [Actinomyces succiniciruminis]